MYDGCEQFLMMILVIERELKVVRTIHLILRVLDLAYTMPSEEGNVSNSREDESDQQSEIVSHVFQHLRVVYNCLI